MEGQSRGDGMYLPALLKADQRSSCFDRTKQTPPRLRRSGNFGIASGGIIHRIAGLATHVPVVTHVNRGGHRTPSPQQESKKFDEIYSASSAMDGFRVAGMKVQGLPRKHWPG